MIKFTILRPSDSRLAPEYRAEYLNIRKLVEWQTADASGTYSGLLIVGEPILGILCSARISAGGKHDYRRSDHDLSAAKVQELWLLVPKAFGEFRR